MKSTEDLGNIKLSRSEWKILKHIDREGSIPDTPLLMDQEPYTYLYRIKLIERFYNDAFPYRDRGALSIPLNAIRISDGGRSVLNRTTSEGNRWKWQLLCDILTILIALAAFIKSFFF